jgi:putative chitinase
MINKDYFFAQAKQVGLFNKFSQKQVDSLTCIFTTWDLSGHTDLRWLAYMLGTAYHETGYTMLPIEEWGKGKGRPYGKKIKHSGVPYTAPDQIYYGRSYVQLTWFENYELMGRLLSVDLLNHPELALTIEVATKILFEGMLKGSSSVGDFTGKCLEMYFNSTTENWEGARRIINGTDKAKKIALHSQNFLKCLKLSNE